MSYRPRLVFVQYLNPEITRLYGVVTQLRADDFLSRALLITRYAVLTAEAGIVVPDSYIFEVGVFDRFVMRTVSLRAAGLVHRTSSTPDLNEYRQQKRPEYRDELTLFPKYDGEPPKLAIPGHPLEYIPRMGSSSGDISRLWSSQLTEGDGLWHNLLEHNPKRRVQLPSKAEEAIAETPERLDGRAFIYRNVEPLLPLELLGADKTNVEFLISRGYLESYLEDLDAVILVDTPLGSLDCGIAQITQSGKTRTISFRALYKLWQRLGMRSYIDTDLSFAALARLREEGVFQWAADVVARQAVEPDPHVDDVLTAWHLVWSRDTSSPPSSPTYKQALDRLWILHDYIRPRLADDRSSAGKESTMDNNDVFLIQGQDHLAASSIASFLRALGLNPIEWEDAVRLSGSTSSSTLAIVKAGLAQAQKAIVLFTPDEDVALTDRLAAALGTSDKQHGCQPRPNVLVEAGMALALYPENTLIVRVGSIREVSDLSGINYVSMADTAEFKQQLVDRLTVMGCKPRTVGGAFLRTKLSYVS